MLRFCLLVQICIFFINSSLLTVDTAAAETNEANLALSISSPKKNIELGDGIPIVFTIINKGSSPCQYFREPISFRMGIFEQYHLIAEYEDGTIATEPPKLDYISRGNGDIFPVEDELEPGETYSKNATLNDWAVIRKPGRYIVTGFYYKNPNYLLFEEDAIVSLPIEIVVEPRSYKQMSDYINELSGKLKSDYMTEVKKSPTAGDRYIDTVRKLIYTCEPRIVPLLLETLYKNKCDSSNSISLLVYRAFLCYLPRDDEITEQITETAKKRGLVPGMGKVLKELGCSEEKLKELIRASLFSNDAFAQSGAIELLLKHPSDEYVSRLITIAREPNHTAQYSATLALAFHRTDEGVGALKEMLESSDGLTRNSAKLAIEIAYERVPLYPETVDRELTAKLIPFARDFNNPKWNFAISVLMCTRTKEGAEAIRSLLVDPNIDVSLAESDEGFKTIKELLNHRNDNVRRETRNIIKYTFGLSPGRPLKKEDFPEFYVKAPKYEPLSDKFILEWLKVK